SGSQNNFVSAGTGTFRIDQFSGRVDHRLTDKDNLFGVYEFADSSEFYPISNPLCSARDVPGWGCDEKQRTQHVALAWIHIFGPRLVNEARIGASRFGFYRLQEDRDVDVVNRLGIKGLTDAGQTPFNNGSPELIVTGFATIGGPTNLPQGRHDNTHHYVENMTFSTSQHALKWGLDIRRFLFNSFFTSFGRGSFRFDGRYTGNSVADMLLGLAFQGDRNLGEPFHNAKTFSSGYYIQDDWKISPKLTLNLGLRSRSTFSLSRASTRWPRLIRLQTRSKLRAIRKHSSIRQQDCSNSGRVLASAAGYGKQTRTILRHVSGWLGARLAEPVLSFAPALAPITITRSSQNAYTRFAANG